MPADEGQVDAIGGARAEVHGLARSGTFSFVGVIANAVLGFVFLLLVGRSLSQSQAGAVFEAIAIFTTASMIATAGAGVGLMRTLPQYRRRSVIDVRRSVAVAVIPAAVIGVILAVVVVVEASQIASILVSRPDLRPGAASDLRVLAPVIPAAGVILVILGGERAWGISWSVGVQYLLMPILRPILFACFAVGGMTVFRALLAWSLPVAVALAVALTLVAFRLRKNSALLPDVVGDEIPMSLGEHASSFWRFAAPRSIEGILLVFITGFDIVLVGALADASTAATYTIANRYSALAIFGLQAMLLAIPTRISDLMHQGLVDQARHLYRVATWWTIGLCWPPAIALAIFAPVFMSVFGRDYRSGSTALVIMSFGVLATSVTGPSGVVLLMSGKSSANLVCTLVAIGLNVPLNLILIPRFGASGGAVAWTVSMIATNVMQMLYLWLMFRMHFFGREFLTVTGLCVGVFLGIGVATRLVLGTTVISLVVFGVISTVVYLVFLVRLRSRLHLDAFAVMMRGMAT